MRKIKAAIVIIVLILIIGALFLVSYLFNRIPPNPDGTVGNTAGNLINNGLFCESDGKVYFANPYDEDTLYVMNPDETQIKKINSLSVQSINAGGKHLYFYKKDARGGAGLGFLIRTTGIYRSKIDGSGETCLKRDPAGVITLVNDNLYWQHYTNKTGTSLDRMATDKSSEETLFTSMISPASVSNGLIYFANPDDLHYLYTFDTYTGTTSLFWQHRVWNPICHGEYIYYMDLETEYQLHRYSPFTGEIQVLTTDRLDTYNIYGDYIYYQRSSKTNPALVRMRLDGSSVEVIANGVFQNINITSHYVYFNEFGQSTPVYRQSTYGPVGVSIFNPVVEE